MGAAWRDCRGARIQELDSRGGAIRSGLLITLSRPDDVDALSLEHARNRSPAAADPGAGPAEPPESLHSGTVDERNLREVYGHAAA